MLASRRSGNHEPCCSSSLADRLGHRDRCNEFGCRVGAVGALAGCSGPKASFWAAWACAACTFVSVGTGGLWRPSWPSVKILAFTIAYTVAMYAVCSVGRPLVDDRLAACDAALGVHLPAVVAWIQRHPAAGMFLDLAYSSMFPQTVFVLVVLGIGRSTTRATRFYGVVFPRFADRAVGLCFVARGGPVRPIRFRSVGRSGTLSRTLLRIPQRHTHGHFMARGRGSGHVSLVP